MIQTKSGADVTTVQTCPKRYPYREFGLYYPGVPHSHMLFRNLRKAVPIIDAAIEKIVRLTGTFEIKTGNDIHDKMIKTFLENVPVNSGRLGIDNFISSFLDSVLTYGTAVGEIVTDGKHIKGLYNSSLKDVALTKSDNPFVPIVSAREKSGEFRPVKKPELILTALLNPEPDDVYGTSLLEGLPFVSDILLRIFDAIGSNWDRIGNVRYCVTYKPNADSTDKAFAKSRAQLIADEWKNTISSSGPVKDFIAVGDIDIKAIGADNQILDSSVPVKQLVEQIVAKPGVPPFLLGLSWSTTERMSNQQADILTSELESFRRLLEPVIRRICSLYFVYCGIRTEFEIVWNDITLLDLTEQAKAELYSAQADALKNKETTP